MTDTVESIVADLKAHNDGRYRVLDERMNEIEQKTDGFSFGHRSFGAETPGSLFTRDEAVKDFLHNASAGRRIGLDVKAVLTSATTDADGSAGDLGRATRDTTVIMPRRRLVVRDLLPVVPVTSGSVEVPKMTGRTNSAATVAENTLKPQSDLKFDMVTVPIRTLAHWMLASRQILDDVPQLQGLIDEDLRYGLAYVEDNQLLNGAGTGTDLNGIYTQATAFAAGSLIITAATHLDVIAAALNQNALADLPADGIVIHPSDWLTMRTLKDADGKYILGAPGDAVEPRLFGLPVVASQAMSVGSFLVGQFRGGATLYDRMQARVEISSEDSDNFRRNLITVLCEERIGLNVKQATAFTKGTFAAAKTDLAS